MKKNYLIFALTALFLFGCKSSMLVDPTTSIRYSLPERSHVKLTIENSYNTIIKTLVNTEQLPGFYSVSFDATNLAEGVYFYTIEAKGIGNDFYYKTTRTMLLVK